MTTPPHEPGAAPPDGLAARLRGWGPAGLGAMLLIILAGNVAVAPMVYIPAGALLVLLWRHLSRTPWRAIGYVRPRSWPATVAAGILFGVALKILMKALVMPLLGAPPVNSAFQFLVGNRALLPAATLAMITVGFAEETVFRGYLFERLGTLLGSRAWAKAAIVVGTSALFGLAHYTQGLAGVAQATVMALVVGTIYAITRQLPFPMITHAAFDLTALALIFSGLETRFAHLIFR